MLRQNNKLFWVGPWEGNGIEGNIFVDKRRRLPLSIFPANMASTSITTFSLHSQSQSNFNFNFNHYLLTLNKRTSISFHPPSTLRATLFSTFTSSLTPSTPSSNFPQKKTLSKFLTEKIVFFLIGSFLITGSFSKRLAFAELNPSANSGSVLEEKEVKEKSEEEEEEMWESVLEKDPRNVEALKVVLYGKIKRGKSTEAVKFVEDLIDVEPNEVEWRLLLALCYEAMGKLSTAKRLFRDILHQNPLLVRALHVMFLAISIFLVGF